MILNGLLNPLWFKSNITLCGGGTAVLQQPLNEDNVVAVVLVDLCGVPLTKTVGADAFVAQVVTDDPKLLLDHPLSDGEYNFCASNPITQAIVLNVFWRRRTALCEC